MKVFKNMQMKDQFRFLWILSLILSILLVSNFTIIVSNNILYNNTEKNQAQLIEQISNNLNLSLKHIAELQFTNYINLSEVLEKNIAGELDFNTLHNEKQIQSYFYDLFFNENQINYIYISDKNNKDYTFDRSENGINYSDYLIEQKIVEEINSSKGKMLWFLGENNEIIMGRKIISPENLKELGFIIIAMDKTYIQEMYNDISISGYQSLYLINVNNFNSLPFNLEDRKIIESEKENLLMVRNFVKRNKTDNKDYVISSSQIGKENLNVVIITDMNVITQYRKILYSVIIAFSLILSLLLSLISNKMVNSITSNLTVLVNRIKDFSNGNYSDKIENMGQTEIGTLANEFNKMSKKIDFLINEVYKNELKEKNLQMQLLESEYAELQSKLNPHFLYNALESVNSLAKMNNQPEISRSILLLGLLLRESINNKNKYVSLKSELDYTQKYLEIQKIMNSDKFHINFVIDENLYTTQVPKFILQPIVENAIIHGIEEMIEPGLIRITGYRELNDLYLTVYNTGKNFDAAHFNEIINQDNSSNHFGIKAVDKRIKILYGNNYGVFLNTKIKIGTDVIIKLPIGDENDV